MKEEREREKKRKNPIGYNHLYIDREGRTNEKSKSMCEMTRGSIENYVIKINFERICQFCISN